MKFKHPPASFDLNSKRQFYIKEMRALDISNNEIVDRIKRMEKHAGKLRAELNKGRQLRDSYRNKIARCKRIYKNKNRAENGSEII